MPVSSSSPSLNRFPGLTLIGYALWKTGVLYKNQNVSSVTNSLTVPVFTFTTPAQTANFTIDVEVGGATFAEVSGRTVNGATLNIKDINGNAKNLPDFGYVAFYG